MFRSVFVSSTMGVRKPERRSFQMVADSVGLPASAFHFFDDSIENVDGANAAGMSAIRVQSFEDLSAFAPRLI